MSSEDAVTSQQRASESSAHKGRGRPLSMLRGTGSQTAGGSLKTGSQTAAGRGGRRGQTAGHRPVQGAEPEGAASEAYLLRLYGRAPYDGLRRTLKKSPYLRLSSPASPLGRKSRPRLVESVTGVKLKSCKTQTCLAPPFTPSPGQPPGGVPMAIPLGRPRMDSSSRRLAERQQEVTSPLTAPPTAGAVAVKESQVSLNPRVSAGNRM
ncbi:protein TALPID3-like [Etheostoma cragini]|uniref:protein TALPID3-like n=1 Tax=Etheostoma cragini TaxID=417921 RepID=UPI00155F3C19|nr:protein TALPID3-like [Etheostoma cragini]